MGMSTSDGHPLGTFGGSALATTYSSSISASTTVTLNAGTKYISITAIDKPVLMRWGAVASTSAHDAVIPAGTTRNFKVPFNTPGVLVTNVRVIEQAATATVSVVEYA